MRESLIATLRTCVVLAFVVALPVLAVPQVGDRLLEIGGRERSVPPGDSTVAQLPGAQSSLPAHQAVAGNLERPEQAPLVTAADSAGGESSRANGRRALADSGVPASGRRFTARRLDILQKRLQELGAIYMRLEEESGQESPMYRFYCQVALPPSSAYSRIFEARDPDPRQAMQRVVVAVESWRTARQHAEREQPPVYRR